VTMVLHYATREGETIGYYDVMSLYPYVCKYSKIPLGHPTIHVGDACNDKQAMLSKEGLNKCTVLPPKRLHQPVLPYRCNNKLCLSMQGVRRRMQFFTRMRTRIGSENISDVNMGP